MLLNKAVLTLNIFKDFAQKLGYSFRISDAVQNSNFKTEKSPFTI